MVSLQIKYLRSLVRSPVQELRANRVAELVRGAVEGEERCPEVGCCWLAVGSCSWHAGDWSNSLVVVVIVSASS